MATLRSVVTYVLRMSNMTQFTYILTTSGSRGAHPARATPNGRGPMIVYAQNANFSHFFLPRFTCINFKHNFNRNMSNTLKHDFYFNLQHYQWFSILPPVDKVNAPPPYPQVKSWNRHCFNSIKYIIRTISWTSMSSTLVKSLNA